MTYECVHYLTSFNMSSVLSSKSFTVGIHFSRHGQFVRYGGNNKIKGTTVCAKKWEVVGTVKGRGYRPIGEEKITISTICEALIRKKRPTLERGAGAPVLDSDLQEFISSTKWLCSPGKVTSFLTFNIPVCKWESL